MGVYKDLSEDDFQAVVDGFVEAARKELLSKTQEELVKYCWYFRYDPSKSKEWNLYEFTNCIDLYKESCIKWETHYNGYSAVVGRVRDKYLMPKIKEFYAALEEYKQ
jgi:hypothetical protein